MLTVCVDSIILIMYLYSFVFLEIVVTCYVLFKHYYYYSNNATYQSQKKIEVIMLTSLQDFTLLY